MIKGDNSINIFSNRLKEKKGKGVCMSLVGATSMFLIFFLDLSLSEHGISVTLTLIFLLQNLIFIGETGLHSIPKLDKIIKKQYKFASFSNTHFHKIQKLLTEVAIKGN